MKCPVCVDIDLVMSERSGVEIDYCPKCRGVWLDRGELDKIIEKNSSHGQSQGHGHGAHHEDEKRYYSRYEGHTNYDKYHGKRKKKSFLGDLFDFD